MAPGSSQPFIMPDGRPLGAFLKEDGQRAGADAGRRRDSVKSKKHGRQATWDRSFRTSAAHAFAGAASSEADRIELEAISKVGRDRRRRWLNDKILRDMAGAMTAADMDSLFKPPPFGGTVPRPSALTAAAMPENMPLWDLFRNIDMEKQHRVLIRWEQHVAEQQGGAAESRNLAASPALCALQAWAGTSRKARDALRRASLEVVHALETRILREVLGVLPPNSLSADASAVNDGAFGSSGSTAAGEGSGGSASPPAAAAPLAAASTPADSPAGGVYGAGPMHGGGGSGSGSGSGGRGSPVPPASRSAGGGATSSPAAPVRPRELQLALPDGFHRLLVHGISQFHGLASFSRDAAGGPQRGPMPTGSPVKGGASAPPGAVESDAAAPHPAPEAEPAAAKPAASMTAIASPERQQPDVSGGVEAGPRITVVRQQQQGEEEQTPDDDLITVSDILLVMDQAGGSGQLTAAMLEVPATPDSRNEPWAIAAAAHATV